ncbi:Gfo/Idh/MocA family oxidoreductase [Duganella sp. SAP-35]|uniref:Gfo/Idh/MocA family oxidoreductase n=1 Tax=Duganella aceris TaxID=2703883 RepID=A0ABX0FKG2_9BURK|nr:Gfo/Idh/MocA family oxidoreductase [Duganella aceris]
MTNPGTGNAKIRVGIIGAGNWAEYGHIPSLKLLPDYELTAVFSRDDNKAKDLAQRHGFKYAVTSLKELVEHPEVDFVLVLTPAPQHEEGIRAAIAAGKDVYCEWPLTPKRALSAELMELAEEAGVRHIVGLQRRLGPDYRYVRQLLADGYIGDLRSVRLHISVEYFKQLRMAALYYTVPEANFSSLLSIYGGHFLDVLFTHFGFPVTMNALTVNQFKEITIAETGVTQAHTSPDQVVLSGTFSNGAVLSVHLEAGKLNNYGLQLDLTGSKGDLKVYNSSSFGDTFNVIEGAQGEGQPLKVLRVPAEYNWLPATDMGGSAVELAHLYAAYARDVRERTALAPTFRDALKMHDVIEAIDASNRTGTRVTLT